MGYHLRTDYNKPILKIGKSGEEITPSGGVSKYGLLKNNYLLLKGSVVGPKKRAVLLMKPNPKFIYNKRSAANNLCLGEIIK